MQLDHSRIAKQLRTDAARLTEAADALDGKKKPVGRVITPQGRRNIAEAQRRRWALIRKKKAS